MKRFLMLLLCSLGLSWTIGVAQTSGGSLAGTITDTTGAVVSHARITVANEATGVSAEVTASDAGYYRFPSLSPGRYTITITSSGFQTLKETGVSIEISSTTSADIALKVGDATTSVEVRSDALQVETESTDVGTVVSATEVKDLPLSVGNAAMRNAGDFVFLTPATYGLGLSGGNFSTSVGGGQSFASDVILDGASAQAMDYSDGLTQEVLPSLDAIQEFKVLIAGIPAQFGRTGGGVQSYTTKSGTNAFHGSAFEYFRNTVLDANDWFNNGYKAMSPGSTSFERPLDKKNEYGLTFGGPIRIPHVYDGHNRTFFFFAWEQFQQIVGVSKAVTVPSTANRAGNFSSTLGGPLAGNPINPCNGQPYLSGQIFDPTTTRTVGGVQCRNPFTGNVVPSTGFSTVAKNLLAMIPTPTSNAQVSNYAFNTSYHNENTAETIRVDHAFRNADRAFASYTARDNVRPHVGAPSLPEPLSLGAPAGNSSFQDFSTHIVRVGYNHLFTPSLLNQFVLGFMRINNTSAMQATRQGVDWDSKLGIQNGFGTAFPYFSFGEQIQSLGGGPGNSVIGNYSNVQDDATFSKGKHSIFFGGEFRHGQYSTILIPSASGQFTFARGETAGTPTQTANTGNGFASFLLGQPSGIGNSFPIHSTRRVSDYGAVYVQDNFKLTPQLLLIAGLRYSVDVPLRENEDADANFSPTTPNSAAGNRPGSLIFAGTGVGHANISSRFADVYYGAVEPRIGFAWSPAALHGLTVFHGNFQMLHSPIQIGGSIFALPPGYTSRISLSDSASGGFVAPQSLDSPLPVLSRQINFDPTQLNGTGSMFYTAPSFGHTGVITAWSGEVQHQLARDLIVTASYIGNRATHLRSDLLKFNDLTPQFYGLGSLLLQPASGSQVPFTGFAGTLAQASRPYPQYLGIDTADTFENIGQASFDALAIKVERRMRNGLTILGSYTWSKQLTDSDTNNPGYGITYTGSGGEIQNSFNLRGEKSVSAQDVPQLLTLSYVYQLPFGQDHKWLNGGGLKNAVVGGWEVAAIHRYQTGQPIAFGCATGIPAVDTCVRYNRVAGQSLLSSAAKSGHFNAFTDSEFNPAAFSDPNAGIGTNQAYRFGNLPRLTGEVRVPNYLSEDISVIKRTKVDERANVTFRADMFNAFNRHAFSFPDASPTDFGFGSFYYTATTPRQVQFSLEVSF